VQPIHQRFGLFVGMLEHFGEAAEFFTAHLRILELHAHAEHFTDLADAQVLV